MLQLHKTWHKNVVRFKTILTRQKFAVSISGINHYTYISNAQPLLLPTYPVEWNEQFMLFLFVLLPEIHSTVYNTEKRKSGVLQQYLLPEIYPSLVKL